MSECYEMEEYKKAWIPYPYVREDEGIYQFGEFMFSPVFIQDIGDYSDIEGNKTFGAMILLHNCDEWTGDWVPWSMVLDRFERNEELAIWCLNKGLFMPDISANELQSYLTMQGKRMWQERFKDSEYRPLKYKKPKEKTITEHLREFAEQSKM